MKTYGAVDVLLHTFLILDLDGGEWSPSRPSRFTPGERSPGTYYTEGSGGLQRRCGCRDEEKNTFPLSEIEYRSPSP
jgi:hypothetical protein